ncbi:hypothetical protein [Caulobacter sp. FWC2]|uniref:hypothetical protein n=1 Tax=Caulobacter sp. FWC2 TaxID=69664 RepID=UPI000C152521|nr:hypothetical protein [Caulobacter sp. FWC2]PIB90974.1 hypothetical protein CSW62_04960 [Caulobacter sp. FWC2]
MTNPNITLTRFKQAHKAATVYDAYQLPAEDISIEDGMDALVQMQRDTAGQPHLWGFSDYKSVHRSDAISSASAIVLEYPDDIADQVRREAQDIAWANYVIETEGKAGNTIAVVFPLAKEITDAKTYSRVATIMAVGMDCYGLTQGCGAITFLIQPRPFAKVETNDGILVDADSRVAAYAGEWFEISKFEGERPSAFRTAAKSAQLDPPTHTNSDLFDWS